MDRNRLSDESPPNVTGEVEPTGDAGLPDGLGQLKPVEMDDPTSSAESGVLHTLRASPTVKGIGFGFGGGLLVLTTQAAVSSAVGLLTLFLVPGFLVGFGLLAGLVVPGLRGWRGLSLGLIAAAVVARVISAYSQPDLYYAYPAINRIIEDAIAAVIYGSVGFGIGAMVRNRPRADEFRVGPPAASGPDRQGGATDVQHPATSEPPTAWERSAGTGEPGRLWPRKAVVLVGSLVVLVGGGLAVGLLLQMAGQGGGVSTLTFGTGGSGCTLDNIASSFPADTPIRVAAEFSPPLSADTVIDMLIWQDGRDIDLGSTIVPGEETTCISKSFDALAAGHYRLEVLPGNGTPISGEFDVTP